jgi:hypothetical protein
MLQAQSRQDTEAQRTFKNSDSALRSWRTLGGLAVAFLIGVAFVINEK